MTFRTNTRNREWESGEPQTEVVAEEESRHLFGNAVTRDHEFGLGDRVIGDEVDVDPTLEEILEEDSALRVSKYTEGLTTAPNEIGGVHGGKVPMAVYSDENGCMRLQAMRTQKEIVGGQIYMPAFKRYIKKNKMVKMNKFYGLASLVQEMLMNQDIFHRTNGREQKAKLVQLVKVLHYLFEHAGHEIGITQGNNSVRVELFYCSTFYTDEMDINFPNIDFSSFCLVSTGNSFFKNYAQVAKCCVAPLMRTFVTEEENRSYEVLSASAKRMLVLHAELCVHLTEPRIFSGKAIGQITRILRETMEDPFLWNVPNDLLRTIPQRDKTFTGLECGLSPQILSLNLDVLSNIQRPSANDNPRQLPAFLNMLERNTSKNQHLPNQYAKAIGTIFSLLWKALEPIPGAMNESNEIPPQTPRTLFDALPYTRLARMDAENAKELILALTKIVSNCYDFEWWSIVRSRTQDFHHQNNRNLQPEDRYSPVIPGVEDFATTTSTLQSLMESVERMQVNVSNDFARARAPSKVTTAGKVPSSTFFFRQYQKSNIILCHG